MRKFFRLLMMGGLGLLQACSSLPVTTHKAPVESATTAPNVSTSVTGPAAPAVPTKVALLLPASGSLAPVARAVQAGFMSAYQREGLSQAPVSVIDTQGDNNVAAAYQTAIAQGANAVVGPLTKKGVQQLQRANNLSVTTLMLNYGDGSIQNNGAVYEFGLAPTDETRQSAMLAIKNNHKRLTILAANNDWGRRLAAAFRAQFVGLGGQIIETVYFQPQGNIDAAVRQVLHINTKMGRSKAAKQQNAEMLKANASARDPNEGVFIAALPSQARQIKPLFAFYYAQDVPLYATSSVYTGTIDPNMDKDLEGVHFCDMPWVLQVEGDVPQNIDQGYTRLYAMGIDAYRILFNLPKLAGTNTSIKGATGDLSLANHRVVRNLACAKFEAGKPLLISYAD